MKDVVKIFKALAGTNRVRIIKLLQERRMCVCELSRVLGISQPSVSRHLKKLISAGLISCEQSGYWTEYFISPAHEQAGIALSCLEKWLNRDSIVVEDRKNILKADRNCLCLKQEGKKYMEEQA